MIDIEQLKSGKNGPNGGDFITCPYCGCNFDIWLQEKRDLIGYILIPRHVPDRMYDQKQKYTLCPLCQRQIKIGQPSRL